MSSHVKIQRWSDTDFITSVKPLLAALLDARRLVGPADLCGFPMISTLTPAEYQWKDLIGVFIKQIDMASCVITCAMGGAELVDVCLSNSQFRNCSMQRMKANRCSFAGAAIVNPWMEDARFEACSFTEAKLAGNLSDVGPHDCGRRVSFIDCDFSRAHFKRIGFAGATFINCRFTETMFESCRVFNWRFMDGSPLAHQFIQCEYRGKNVGINLAP